MASYVLKRSMSITTVIPRYIMIAAGLSAANLVRSARDIRATCFLPTVLSTSGAICRFVTIVGGENGCTNR